MGKLARLNKSSGLHHDRMGYVVTIRASAKGVAEVDMAIVLHRYDLRATDIASTTRLGLSEALVSHTGQLVKVLIAPQTDEVPPVRVGVPVEYPPEMKLSWRPGVAQRLCDAIETILQVRPHPWGWIEICDGGDDKIERHVAIPLPPTKTARIN